MHCNAHSMFVINVYISDKCSAPLLLLPHVGHPQRGLLRGGEQDSELGDGVLVDRVRDIRPHSDLLNGSN